MFSSVSLLNSGFIWDYHSKDFLGGVVNLLKKMSVCINIYKILIGWYASWMRKKVYIFPSYLYVLSIEVYSKLTFFKLFEVVNTTKLASSQSV